MELDPVCIPIERDVQMQLFEHVLAQPPPPRIGQCRVQIRGFDDAHDVHLEMMVIDPCAARRTERGGPRRDNEQARQGRGGHLRIDRRQNAVHGRRAGIHPATGADAVEIPEDEG
jgi:hypothetical protein